MPEPTEQSTFAEPAESGKTAQQLLEERYDDRENPDDMDDMVRLSSDRENTPIVPEVVQYVLNEGESYVYVPRKSTDSNGVETTRVEKWKVTGEVDQDTGKQLAFSLTEQEKDGNVGILQKGLSEASLSVDVQEALKMQYQEALRDMGHQALEVVEAHDPSEFDGRFKKYGSKEMREIRAKAAEVSAREVAELATSAPQVQPDAIDEETKDRAPVSEVIAEAAAQPEQEMNPKQERYKLVKVEMAKVIDEISDTSAGYEVLDTLRLDDYAKGMYRNDHNEQTRAVNGMSKKLLGRTDLLTRYVDLHREKEDLLK